MDCNLPGSSVHGILQARILEWVAICFCRGSSWPRDRAWTSCITGRLFMVWASRRSTLGKVRNSRKGTPAWSAVSHRGDHLMEPTGLWVCLGIELWAPPHPSSHLRHNLVSNAFLLSSDGIKASACTSLCEPCIWYTSGGSHCVICEAFPGGSGSKESSCSVGDPGLIPGLRRSPGEGNGNPLQCSCLENPMDREVWRASVHGAAKNWTQLSNWHFHFH